MIEAAAAVGLSLAGVGGAGLQTQLAFGGKGSRLAHGLGLVSGLALTGTMVLSILYGLRSLHHWPRLDLPWMRAWHGTGNALGACLAGVVGH